MPHGGTIINFPGQEADEQLFIFARRHPLAFLPQLATILAMTILGLVMIYFLGLGNVIAYNIQILVGSAFLLFMLLFTLFEFFDFYFDLNIATDRRIIDIDQKRLFNRDVAELLYEDVEDVNATVKGILATFFDFGDVAIQTAGTTPNFLFDQIAHPREIAAIILDISDQQANGVPPTARHPEGTAAAVIDGVIYPHTADHKNEIP